MAYGTKIYRVERVLISFDGVLPARLVIQAQGVASTPGWSQTKLIPYVYDSPPPDGIQECDFIASPPSDPVHAILTPVAATATIEAVPDWVVGVRVYAAANRVVQRI